MGVLLKLNLLLLLVFIERKSSCKVIFYCFTPELQTLTSAPNADLPVLSRSLEGVLFCFVFVEFFLQFLRFVLATSFLGFLSQISPCTKTSKFC